MRRIVLLILALSWLAFVDRTAAQDKAQLEIGGGRIDVIFTSAPGETLRKLVLVWVASSARAVTVYYGQFPVSNVQLRIRLFEGRGVRGGQTTVGTARRSRLRSDDQAALPTSARTGS